MSDDLDSNSFMMTAYEKAQTKLLQDLIEAVDSLAEEIKLLREQRDREISSNQAVFQPTLVKGAKGWDLGNGVGNTGAITFTTNTTGSFPSAAELDKAIRKLKPKSGEKTDGGGDE